MTPFVINNYFTNSYPFWLIFWRLKLETSARQCRHVSKSIKNWFQKERIEILNWPSCISDLNPTENLWSHLAHQVYANNRQYDSEYELELAIINKWDKIPKFLLENLINSMKN